MQPAPARWEGDDLILEVLVQPRSKKDEIVGLQDGRVKIRITASPVEGKANRHLIHLLAKAFGVAKSRVLLVHGESGRSKRLRVQSPTRLPSIIPPRDC